MANIENCFIKSNVDFTAASGWLQRLVRPFEMQITRAHRRLAWSDVDVSRHWNVHSLACDTNAPLNPEVITPTKLCINESPSGIHRTWNIMKLEVDNAVVIAVIIFHDFLRLDAPPLGLVFCLYAPPLGLVF